MVEGKIFAVVGVSQNPEKYGSKVFFFLKEDKKIVYPINPKTNFIGEYKCYKKISDLPKKPNIVITVVKPEITKEIVKECLKLGVEQVWMQPGSESKEAISFCKKNGIKSIVNTCIMITKKEAE